MAASDVIPVHLADVHFPAGHPQEGEQGPVFAFALVHPEGVVLFDTGVGVGEPDVEELFRPTRRPLPEALAARGIDLGDVVAVVNSHLHFDHCGQNRLFPGTPIFVQSSEYRAAHEPDYTVPGWVDFPGATYEVLRGEAEVLSGTRVIPTPGHTPGHQSVMSEAAGGPVVVAGQAVYTAAEWEGSVDPRRSGRESAWDPARYEDSVRRLRDLAPRRLLFSHDAAIWEPT